MEFVWGVQNSGVGCLSMDLAEMTDHLEAIARSEKVPPSARVRAIEVLLRISKTATRDDLEWDRIVREFGGRDVE